MTKAKKTRRRSGGGGRGRGVCTAVSGMGAAGSDVTLLAAELTAALARLGRAPTIKQAQERRVLAPSEVADINREICRILAHVLFCQKAIEKGNTGLARGRWATAGISIAALCDRLETTEADAREMDSVLPKIDEIVKNLPKGPPWAIREAKYFARGARAAIRGRNRKLANSFLGALIKRDEELRRKGKAFI